MPVSSFNKFNAFIEAVHHKKHDLSLDEIRVALCTNANAPVAGNSVLTDLTVVSLANLVSEIVTVASSGQVGGVYDFKLTDKTLQASGGAVGPFQWIVIYNNTATNKDLIGYQNYGSEITLADGESLLLDFAADGYFDNQ